MSDDVRLERLNNMIEDVASIAEDLDEFFPGEFDDIALLLDRARQALWTALTTPVVPEQTTSVSDDTLRPNSSQENTRKC